MVKRWVFGIFSFSLIAGILLGQSKAGGPTSGVEIFRSACAACHGPTGEARLTARAGLKNRAPSLISPTALPRLAKQMTSGAPSFTTAGRPGVSPKSCPRSGRRSPTIRSRESSNTCADFCREPAWPRGELNLPRALVTEKAFPEDEMVMDVAIDAEGDAGVTDRVVYERRFGARGQLDVSVPFRFQKPGDAGLGQRRGGSGCWLQARAR